MKVIKTLLYCLVFIFLFPSAQADITNIYPVQFDTYVTNFAPNTYYNTSTLLYADDTGGNFYRILLNFSNFNLSTHNITSASLYFYVGGTSLDPVAYIYPITSAWVSATWNLQPTYGSLSASKTTDFTLNAWNSINVTNIAQSWANGTQTNYGILIRTTETSANNFLRISSKEHANGNDPYLEVASSPKLLSPSNGSTQYYNYPPQTTEVNFTWTSGASAYNLQVAKDINFNLMSVDTTVATNYSVQSLQGTQEYFWKARTYNSTSGTYGSWSDTFSFTLQANTTATGTGIQGVVYEINDDGDILPIEGATVYIANSTLTYSASFLTGSNGYYLASNLSNQTTYQIYATKNNYLNSQTEYVTTGTYAISTKDIIMKRCISGFECGLSSQYVKFIVQTLWGTTFTGVTATVYLGDAVVASDSGTTGSDGAVGFFLVKDQRYRLTFIDASQGVNTAFYVIPTDTLYYVIVDQSIPIWGDSTSEHEAISLTVYNELVGSTGYVNATFNDTMGGTTSLIFYLNQTNHTNGSASQTNIQTINAGASSNYSANFTGIASAGGRTYLVNVVAEHSTYGTVYRTLGVRFAGMPSNILSFMDDGIKALVAIAFIFFVGAMATERTRAMVSLLVCVMGWIFLFAGFFNYFNTTAMAGGLVMGSLISVMWTMSERRKSEGIP